MKEFFKNIFEVIYYIGLVIGGTILCSIAIIPVFAIILLVCLPFIILVLPFMILSLPFSIIGAVVQVCYSSATRGNGIKHTKKPSPQRWRS